MELDGKVSVEVQEELKAVAETINHGTLVSRVVGKYSLKVLKVVAVI